jgi:hypothetical protein
MIPLLCPPVVVMPRKQDAHLRRLARGHPQSLNDEVSLIVMLLLALVASIIFVALSS